LKNTTDKKIAPFLTKTFEILNSNTASIKWGETNDSFIIVDPVEFGKNILPKYFKHNNICSFVRQLSTYSFTRVDNQSEKWEFRNPFFKKDSPELMLKIERKKSKKRSHTDVDINQEANSEKKREVAREPVHETKPHINEIDTKNPIKVAVVQDDLISVVVTLQREVDRLKEESHATQQVLGFLMEEIKTLRNSQQQVVPIPTDFLDVDFSGQNSDFGFGNST